MKPVRLVSVLAASMALALTGCQTPAGGSGSVSTDTTYLSFPGTSTATFTLTASSVWHASTDQSWLSVSPASGSGNATLTATVDRSSLAPGTYAATITVRSGAASADVTVMMRFAQVSGNITGPSGQILPQSVAGATAPAAPYVPGEVLLKVDPAYVASLALTPRTPGAVHLQAVEPQAIASAAVTVAQAHGFRVRSRIAPDSPWVVLDTRGVAVPQALEALAADTRVAAAQPNTVLHPSALSVPSPTGASIAPQATPSDPYFGYQWDMQVLGMPSVWDVDTGSTDVVVAVVDTGVMASHPDVQANVAYAGYDFVLNQPGATTPVSDGDYHGTHVAGTIGAIANNGIGVVGMAWHVKILPVRVCTKAGCALDDVIRGIEYAAGLSVYDGNGTLVAPPARAGVMNLSLGGSTGSSAEQDALSLAAGNGTTIVAAAGNDGTNCSYPVQFGTQTSPSLVSYPAAYPQTIAVGSVDYDQGIGWVAASCFSDGGAPSGGQGVTVSAPGGFLFDGNTPVSIPSGITDESGSSALGIVSTWWASGSTPSYASLVGTSMAAPHVVGLVALMLAQNPSLTPDQIKLTLANTAIGTGSYDDYLGYGMISAGDAVSAARGSVTANASDFRVQLWQGGTLVAQTQANAAGDYTLTDVPAGSYTVIAGNDANANGSLGDPGEFYGQAIVTVTDAGDKTGVGVDVTLQ